jgi:hypothetical protein
MPSAPSSRDGAPGGLASLASLEARCRRQARRLEARAVFERWSQGSWVGLSVLLLVLGVAKAAGQFRERLVYALPAWVAATALWALWGRRRREAWPWVAYLDRVGGQRGRLMKAFELGERDVRFDPALSTLSFPGRPALRSLWGWLVVALSAALLDWVPAPTIAASIGERPTPLHVERASRMVDELERMDPRAEAFVDSARRTLRRLAAKSEGLQRSDFESVERIATHASSLLDRRARRLESQRRAIEALRDIAANRPGDPQNAGRGGTLAERLGRQRELLERSGLSPEQVRSLLDEARKLESGESGSGGRASPEARQAFTERAIRSIRRAMGEKRELSAGRGAGQAGVSRGPGSAPLELSHDTREPADPSFRDMSYSARRSRDTVVLAMGRSRRGEAGRADFRGRSARDFAAGGETFYRERDVSPRHRAVLESYFGGGHE